MLGWSAFLSTFRFGNRSLALAVGALRFALCTSCLVLGLALALRFRLTPGAGHLCLAFVSFLFGFPFRCCLAFGVWHLGVWRLAFGVGLWPLAFGLWRLAFGVWRLAFGVWRGGVWRVACGVWRVACGVWRVACGVWRVAFGVSRFAFRAQGAWRLLGLALGGLALGAWRLGGLALGGLDEICFLNQIPLPVFFFPFCALLVCM